MRNSGAIAAAGLSFALLVHSPYWALAGFAAAGAGFSSIIPLAFAAGGRIPELSEGAGVATVSGLGYLGFLVGPPAIGFLSELSSLRVGLFLLVVLLGLGICFYVLPYGLGWFAGAVLLTIAGILLVVPRWLR